MTVRLPPSVDETSDGTSTVYTIDFREMAPASAHEIMYAGKPNLARWGGLAVGVPGELRGLKTAHERWGKLEWSELVEPSVRLAKGWKVSKELERRIEVRYSAAFRNACRNSLIKMFALLMHNEPTWKEIFAPEGCLLHEGDIIRRTALSRTLATIAAEGPDAFYKVQYKSAVMFIVYD